MKYLLVQVRSRGWLDTKVALVACMRTSSQTFLLLIIYFIIEMFDFLHFLNGLIIWQNFVLDNSLVITTD